MDNQNLKNKLIEVPFQNFKEIIGSQFVSIKNEFAILQLIAEYIEKRQTLEERPVTE